MRFLELIIYIKASFDFKLLQYCLTHVNLDFVLHSVSLMQQVPKLVHALPSPFWPQVNDQVLKSMHLMHSVSMMLMKPNKSST